MTLRSMLQRVYQFKALQEEEIRAWWYDWRAYLDAHRSLLDLRAAADRLLFEQDDQLDEQERQAQQALARLPEERRAVFDAVRERECRETQQALEQQARTDGTPPRVTPDQAERAALERLHALALGRDSGGAGTVPLAPEEDAWLTVDVAALEGAPTEQSYQLRHEAADEQRRAVLLASLIIGAGVLALGLWFVFGHAAPPQPRAEAPAASVNGAPVEAWPWERLDLLSAGTRTTLPVSQTAALSWPNIPAGQRRAVVQTGALWPVRLCVPGALLAGASELELGSDAERPVRRYTLTAARPSDVDLVVEPCEAQRADTVRYGVLRDIPPLPAQPLGAPVALPEGDLTVRSIRLVGSGQAPELPEGQAQVLVEVAHSAALDWPRYAPALLLADGRQLAPSERNSVEGSTLLRYLVPLPDSPAEVVWQIVPPGGTQALRWRTSLEPSPTRDQLLRAALLVQQVEAALQPDGRLSIQIRLANRSAAPLALTRDDIQLDQGGGAVALPELPDLRTPLAPDETRVITFDVTTTPNPPLTLTVGPFRFAIGQKGGDASSP